MVHIFYLEIGIVGGEGGTREIFSPTYIPLEFYIFLFSGLGVDLTFVRGWCTAPESPSRHGAHWASLTGLAIIEGGGRTTWLPEPRLRRP